MDSKTSAASTKTEAFPPHRVFFFPSLMLGVASTLWLLASLMLVGCDPIWVSISLQSLGVSSSAAPRFFFLPSASARLSFLWDCY